MDSNKDNRKSIHDLKSAGRTLQLAVKDIQNGYKFDDAMAAEKIRLLEEVSVTLQKFIADYVALMQEKPKA